MSKIKKILLTVTANLLVAALAIGGTLAYLKSTDSDVNVMTTGNVSIEQIEQERDENGKLVDFKTVQPIYPAVFEGSSINWAPENEWIVAGDQAWKTVEDNENVIDKFVTVKNNGKTAAYVRTLIAYEGDATYGPNGDYIHIVTNGTNVDPKIPNNFVGYITVDGVEYTVYEYVYPVALLAGETSIPSLKQVYMNKAVDNDVVAHYGRSYDILVISQAVQADGFASAEAALDEGFGKSNIENATKWFGGIEAPIVVYELSDLKRAAKNGGTCILAEDLHITDKSEFFYSKYITAIYNDMILDLNGHDIVVDVPNNNPSNAPVLFYVYAEGASLTIVGDGNITAKHNAFIVFPRGVSDGAYIYGGNYYNDDATSGTSGDINAIGYSQTGKIQVYGGTFTFKNVNGHCGAFNVYDNSGAEIVLHEGVLLSNPNYYTGSDADEIHLAEGCALSTVEIDGKTWYKVVKRQAGLIYDEADLISAIANGDDEITLAAPVTISGTLDIAADTVINGNGFKLSRSSNFDGTMINAKEGVSLTLEDITVDGGAVWSGEVDPTLLRGTTNSGATATGNLVAAEKNAKIILNEGAVLQNNVGSHAVNLGTRIGATLTINGGEIINNQSDSGAIWGGGHIVMNSGKINGNSSTGSAGAIRMVSSCNLTIISGEINHNKAAADGGVIWGYGSSVYTFSGGEMSYNEAGGTGGAIYTGNYSTLNISGDFELCNNKASNSGAIRLTDHTSMNMSGGKMAGNTQGGASNAFNTWNNSITLSGGEIADDFSFVGGLGLTIGAADIDGVVNYNLSTNHNTAYLKADFGSFEFYVNENDEHFANFNFKPASDYVYTDGDEAKLICKNNGYSTYWDAASGTFKLKAN